MCKIPVELMVVIQVLLSAALLSTFACARFDMPDRPKIPDQDADANIGPDGPFSEPHWVADSIYGFFDRGDYHDTGGDWYIVRENDALLTSEWTQLYLNPDKDVRGVEGWMLWKQYRVSDRFLYIEDPLRAYVMWDYVLFVYHEPRYGDE